MYCPACGRQMDGTANFCAACGTAVAAPLYPVRSRLFRSRDPRMIAGICAGLARIYGWDVALVRLVAALLIVFTGVGAIAYLIAWIVIPLEPMWLPTGVSGAESRTT